MDSWPYIQTYQDVIHIVLSMSPFTNDILNCRPKYGIRRHLFHKVDLPGCLLKAKSMERSSSMPSLETFFFYKIHWVVGKFLQETRNLSINHGCFHVFPVHFPIQHLGFMDIIIFILIPVTFHKANPTSGRAGVAVLDLMCIQSAEVFLECQAVFNKICSDFPTPQTSPNQMKNFWNHPLCSQHFPLLNRWVFFSEPWLLWKSKFRDLTVEEKHCFFTSNRLIYSKYHQFQVSC